MRAVFYLPLNLGDQGLADCQRKQWERRRMGEGRGGISLSIRPAKSPEPLGLEKIKAKITRKLAPGVSHLYVKWGLLLGSLTRCIVLYLSRPIIRMLAMNRLMFTKD